VTRTALLTRAADDAAPLAEGLRALGYAVVQVPLVAKRAFPDRVARAAAEGHDGWVLTSPAAVDALATTAARPRWIAAVGPSTADAARRVGLSVDVVPERALGAALVEALGPLPGQRVLYPRGDLAPPDLAEGLRAAGAVVDAVVAYENVEPDGAGPALRACWPVDLVPLLSGSAAARLAAHLPPPWPDRVRVVAIGPSTAEVARASGLPVHAVAEPHTLAGLLAAVAARDG
jgi:uroporphyrinogen-III synthase